MSQSERNPSPNLQVPPQQVVPQRPVVAEPSGNPNPLSGAAYSPQYNPQGMKVIPAYTSYPSQAYGVDATNNASPFKGVVFHHDPAANIKYYGTVDQQRGGQFGYHFAIAPDGTIYQTAPMNARTNHIGNRGFEGLNPNQPLDNSNSIGITYLGGSTPTPSATAAMQKLVQSLNGTYGNLALTSHPGVSKAGHRGDDEGRVWLQQMAKMGFKTM